MDSYSLDRLQHRCGTCGDIFRSIEELLKHEQSHTFPADEISESESEKLYARLYHAHKVEISHGLNHGRAR